MSFQSLFVHAYGTRGIAGKRDNAGVALLRSITVVMSAILLMKRSIVTRIAWDTLRLRAIAG